MILLQWTLISQQSNEILEFEHVKKGYHAEATHSAKKQKLKNP